MIKKLLKKNTKTTRAKKAATKKTTARKRTKKVSQEEMNSMIQELAYKYFEERGFSHGDDLSDWVRAESEIKKKYKA